MNSSVSWTSFDGNRGSTMTISEEDRVAELEQRLQESERARQEALGIIDEVKARLDAASSELRKRGDYPLASQLDRDRVRLEKRANGIKSDD